MSQKPLPLGEVSPKVTERARTLTEMSEHSDSIALIKAFDYRCIPSFVTRLPSQALRASSPKGRAFNRRSSQYEIRTQLSYL